VEQNTISYCGTALQSVPATTRNRPLQGTCNEGVPCFLGQCSGTLIGSIRTQALPTNNENTRTRFRMFMRQDLVLQHAVGQETTQKRACVRPRFEELCAGIDSRRDLSCAHLLDTPDKMPGFLLKTINHCEAGGGGNVGDELQPGNVVEDPLCCWTHRPRGATCAASSRA